MHLNSLNATHDTNYIYSYLENIPAQVVMKIYS